MNHVHVHRHDEPISPRSIKMKPQHSGCFCEQTVHIHCIPIHIVIYMYMYVQCSSAIEVILHRLAVSEHADQRVPHI